MSRRKQRNIEIRPTLFSWPNGEKILAEVVIDWDHIRGMAHTAYHYNASRKTRGGPVAVSIVRVERSDAS